MTTINGFSVSDKATKQGKSEAVKLQSTVPYPFNAMMVHHDNHHRPMFPTNGLAGAGAVVGGHGPTLDRNRCISNNIYDVFGGTTALASGAAASGGGGGAAVGARTLQPFDISSTVHL